MPTPLTAERAQEVAAEVVDPELPMLTLADLGVLREVEVHDDTVRVTLTPTYTGCPATAAMRDDLAHRLRRAGAAHVDVRLRLSPPWTTAWISERGRRALTQHGLSAPGPVPRHDGPVPLRLLPTRRDVRCPRCASDRVRVTSEFGPTACTALYRCEACAEPFEHVKEI